ncbi:MAG: discoidin domain-containing protein [Flavobacterium sp.]
MIYYEVKNLDQKSGDQIYLAYSKPFIIKESSIVTTYVLNNGQKSNTISATFFKKPNNYTINIKSTYNPQYHAGGPEGLLDGIHGTENWRKGDWQGYQTQDFEAVVDLQKTMPITAIKASFLQDQRSWILLPKQVEYYVSNDNKTFELVEIVTHNIDPKLDQNIVHFFDSNKKIAEARYVKVIARNFGKLPEWHIGHPYNGEAFIFIDEIIIK